MGLRILLVFTVVVLIACSGASDSEVSRLEERIAELEAALEQTQSPPTESTTPVAAATEDTTVPPTILQRIGDRYVYRLNPGPGQREIRVLLTRLSWMPIPSTTAGLWVSSGAAECDSEEVPRVNSTISVRDGGGDLVAVGEFTTGLRIRTSDPSDPQLCGLAARIVVPDAPVFTLEIAGRNFSISTGKDWHWLHWYEADEKFDGSMRLVEERWLEVTPSD